MQILANHPLQACNTLALKARARYFLRADSAAALREGLDFARAEGLELLPLGEGSNVVFAGNTGALALQLATRGIVPLGERAGAVTLRIEAGENWHGLVAWAVARGLYGIENLALIPGCVGAAPIQNIGAYGVELAQCLTAVHALEISSGRALSLSRDECQLGYRDSVFKHELRDRLVITALDITLTRRAQAQAQYPSLAAALAVRGITEPRPEDVFETVIAVRRERLPDPARVPNAGSFFKNPLVPSEQAGALQATYPELPAYEIPGTGQWKLPAAWLIEHCGWKGHSDDGVGVHAEHALVLVNQGADDGARLLALAGRIRDSVRACFNVELEIEPRVYGQVV